MRIFCTGGCGFLGTNLTAYALARGDEILVFDNLSRKGSVDNLTYLRQLGLRNFVHGDIRNRDAVLAALKEARPDVVFHVAGQVAMTTSIQEPQEDAQINIIGTLNVLDAARSVASDCLVIYSSTNKVYGDLDWIKTVEESTRYVNPSHPDGIDETTALNFRSPYGCSKGAADQYVLDYARLFGLRGIVFRHSSMYGDRQFATADQGWVGWFAAKVLEIARSDDRVGDIYVSGSGKQVRDMLHADDMVDLYFRAAERSRDLSGEAFNIGGGMANALSVSELIHIFARELDCKVRILSNAWRASDQRVFVADVSKAINLIGWRPKISYKIGLKKMIEWVSIIESNGKA